MTRRSSINFGPFLDSLHSKDVGGASGDSAERSAKLRARLLTTLAQEGPLPAAELLDRLGAHDQEALTALLKAREDGLVHVTSSGEKEVLGLTKLASQLITRTSR